MARLAAWAAVRRRVASPQVLGGRTAGETTLSGRMMSMASVGAPVARPSLQGRRRARHPGPVARAKGPTRLMRSARDVERSARVNGAPSTVSPASKGSSQRAANRSAFCTTRAVSGLRTTPDCLMSPPVCRAAQASRASLAPGRSVPLISASYQWATASRYVWHGWGSPMTRAWLATWISGLSGMAPGLKLRSRSGSETSKRRRPR